MPEIRGNQAKTIPTHTRSGGVRWGATVQALERLTRRERDVLQLIGQGLSTHEIARKLHRSIKTIQTHRLSLGRKLEVRNRVELARVAIQAGLVTLNGHHDTSAANAVPADAAPPAHGPADLEKNLADVVGMRFFEGLLRGLSAGAGEGWALIAEHDRPAVGQWRVLLSHPNLPAKHHDIPLPMEGSLCSLAARERTVAIHRGAHQRLPRDVVLGPLRAESAFLVALTDAGGQVIGTLALLAAAPSPDDASPLGAMHRFANRAGAELEELRARHHLRAALAEAYTHMDVSQMSLTALSQLTASEFRRAHSSRHCGCASHAEAAPQPGPLERALDSAEDMVLRLDRELRHVFVNAAVTRITRIGRDALLGRSAQSVGLLGEASATWTAEARDVFDTGRGRLFTFDFAGADGLRRYEARMSPEGGDNEAATHLLVVVRDISDRTPAACANP